MNEKMTQQIENAKAQTFGVEIEMNNITREDAAIIAAGFFGTNIVEYTHRRNGYSTWSAWDNEGREWKFQKDVSIKGPDDQKCEMVTPILTYKDMENLQELVRKLRKAGAKSSASRGCGVHIHIGAKGHTAQSLRTLTNLMASHEDLIKEALELDDARVSRFCRTVNPNYLAKVNSKKPKNMAALADIWYTSQGENYGRDHHYNGSRYAMLNLHATFTKGTVEFRLFEFDDPKDGKQNGLHAGQLKAWIQFCLTLSQLAKEIRTANPKQQQRENKKFAMRTWMNRLGLMGDEFKTCREVFTKKLSGNAAWRFQQA